MTTDTPFDLDDLDRKHAALRAVEFALSAELLTGSTAEFVCAAVIRWPAASRELRHLRAQLAEARELLRSALSPKTIDPRNDEDFEWRARRDAMLREGPKP